jgi:hypothetical protein
MHVKGRGRENNIKKGKQSVMQLALPSTFSSR